MSERITPSQTAEIDVDLAFDADKRQAQADYDSYLAGRHYQDDKGNIHDATAGNFTTANESENAYYNRMLDESSSSEDERFAGKSLKDLALLVREARQVGDKTAEMDARYAFDGKFIEVAEKYGWEGKRENRDGTEDDRNEIADRKLAYFESIMESTEPTEVSKLGTSDEDLEVAPENLEDDDDAAVVESDDSTADEEEGEMSAKDISARRKALVKSGVPALDVGYMTDAEVAAWMPELTAEEIRDKRAKMVQDGLVAREVGNMTAEEIAAYNLVEKEPETPASDDSDDLEQPDDEVTPLQNENTVDDTDTVEPLQNEATGTADDAVEPLQNENDPADTEDEVVPLQNTNAIPRSRRERVRALASELRNPLASMGARLSSWTARRRDAIENPSNDERADRREKQLALYGMLGVVGIAAVATAAGYLSSRGHDTSGFTPGTSGGGNAPGVNDILSSATSTADEAGASGGGGDVVGDIVDNFSEKVRNVRRGEGGFQTLSEAGVPKGLQESTWEQVGRELQRTGQGNLVYRMNDGRFGWANSGQLNSKALETIARVIGKQ